MTPEDAKERAHDAVLLWSRWCQGQPMGIESAYTDGGPSVVVDNSDHDEYLMVSKFLYKLRQHRVEQWRRAQKEAESK